MHLLQWHATLPLVRLLFSGQIEYLLVLLFPPSASRRATQESKDRCLTPHRRPLALAEIVQTIEAFLPCCMATCYRLTRDSLIFKHKPTLFAFWEAAVIVR